MSPCTVLTHAPVRPAATRPASTMPMMKQPNTVPSDRRLAAEDRGAADQHGGDGGQQIALALVAEEVLVLERQHDRGAGGEKAHEREDLDLLAIDVDADDARHVIGIADEQSVLAEPVAGEDEPEKANDDRRPQRLDRQLRAARGSARKRTVARRSIATPSSLRRRATRRTCRLTARSPCRPRRTGCRASS